MTCKCTKLKNLVNYFCQFGDVFRFIIFMDLQNCVLFFKLKLKIVTNQIVK
jgi:hypothetical protein